MSRFSNLAGFAAGHATVTTSGTPVQMTAKVVPAGCSVVIKAKTTNTGSICVGNSSANALNSSTAHFRLTAGTAIALAVQNMNAIWLDSTVSAEGVEFMLEV